MKVNEENHILACLSSSPSNDKIIRMAADLSQAYAADFTVLFVEGPHFVFDIEKDANLQKNFEIAQSLGARIEIANGADIPYQIAEFARLSHVTKIVIGESPTNMFTRKHSSIGKKIVEYLPDMDVLVIPTKMSVRLKQKHHHESGSFTIKDSLQSIGILLLSTCVGFLFYNLHFTEANIITVYILGVLFISIITKHRIYSMCSSCISVLMFNYLFTEPRFSLQAYDRGYPFTFLFMFISSFITSSLAIKLKDYAQHSALVAYRTQLLFDTNQMLQVAPTTKDIIAIGAHQLNKLLSKNIAIYVLEGDTLTTPTMYLYDQDGTVFQKEIEEEFYISEWVVKNNCKAGASTKHFKDAHCLHLAIRVNQNIYGVVLVQLHDLPIEDVDDSVMVSILGQCALALENRRNLIASQEAAVLAGNERLRANLLRSISHDLRTPLTSILGNASNLISKSEVFEQDTRMQLYKDIYDDSLWLISLIENLLAITRIENGNVELNYSIELIDDIVEEAMKHTSREHVHHHIHFVKSEEFLFVKVDVRLIVLVFVNLIDNAIKYTQEGSNITISAYKSGNKVITQVKDDGPGICDASKETIFDMFYSTPNKVVDSRRSLGLGLSLCKSIIQAHTGTIEVSDHEPTGSIFTFTLPYEEVDLNE